jgi:hypothetical protein
MKRAVTLLIVLVAASCVGVKKGEVEELKPAVEAFHQRVRWKDFRGAADLMVEERRAPFIKARAKLKDERDLFITNFELEDAKISADLMAATAVTRISWYRLPSTTEETATVTSLFVWREGTWQLESQDEGPFEELKPAPIKPRAATAPDAG